MQPAFFENMVLVLLIVTLMLVLFARLGLPSILGYLTAGVLAGPDMLNLLSSKEEMEFLSQIGIILMMFMIGLDFSWPRLRRSLHTILWAGGACVVVTAAVTMAIAVQYGVDAPAAFLIGGAVAMSSSAVINKQLTDQKEFYDSHGKMAFGITLFQDFAVLLFLAAIPALVKSDSATSLATNLALSLGTAACVLVSIYFIGQKLERPLMRYVGMLRSNDVFVLVTLLVILGAAWISGFFDLPESIGAFLAGMVIGETEFKYKVEDDIRPFRDIMVGVFFIVTGAFLKFSLVMSNLPLLLGVLLGVLALKLGLTTLVVWGYSRNFGNAVRCGLILSSCDELSLMIVLLGMKAGLIDAATGNMLLIVFVLTLVISTLLIIYNKSIAFSLMGFFGRQPVPLAPGPGGDEGLRDIKEHIILCGFGETGKYFQKILRLTGVPIVAIDTDPHKIEQAMKLGCHGMYGDSANMKTLEAAGIARARAVLVTFDNHVQCIKLLQKVRSLYAHLPVICRVHHMSHMEDLMQFGATAVFPDGLGASQALRQEVMKALNIPPALLPDESRMIRDALRL